MKNTKKQPKINKCRFCRKDFIDVGLHPEETLMVPDCDCQKVTITIDRKMLANLMNYANNGIVYSLLCDMLVNGKERQPYELQPLECESKFHYIREIVEKQTGMRRTEFVGEPPGYVKIYNLIKQKIAPLEEDIITKDCIEFRGRKIQLPRWIKLQYQISPNKACRYCGLSYMESSLLFGKNHFLYSVKPRCSCKDKIRISINKGVVGYLLGAIHLGKWTEEACAQIIHCWSNSYDDNSKRYDSLLSQIMDDIKTETGIEEEKKGFGEHREALTFIAKSIKAEVDKCNEEKGLPIQSDWDFLRQLREIFRKDEK